MRQHPDSNYNFLFSGAATHVGQVRKANEDDMAAFETANMKVFVVCDGMGGHVGGKAASQTAVSTIRDFLTNNIMLDPREAIYNAIIAANEAILNRSARQPELAGMGSTCVMLVVTSDGKVYYGHVGDSRIYIIANHRIRQLTEDHSVVYEMFKKGMIKTREEMERHPRKNEITNALGLPDMQPPTVCDAPIEPDSGNCFLLCSDGLTGMVDDEQIQRVVSKHDMHIQQRADKLVQMANANGGVDNITVQLVEFTVGTQQINDCKDKKTKHWQKTLLYVLPIVLILTGGATAWWFLSGKGKGKTGTEIVSENGKKIIEIDSEESIACEEGLIEFSPKYNHNSIKMKRVTVPNSDIIECSIYSNDSTIIVFKWLVKDFFGEKINIICETDNEEYRISIPVKREHVAIAIMPPNEERVIERPIEITLTDTVFIVCKNEECSSTINLSNDSRLSKERWSREKLLPSSDAYGELLSSEEAIKVDLNNEEGELSIVWKKNTTDELPAKVTVTCKTKSGKVYRITIWLKETTDKKSEDTELNE